MYRDMVWGVHLRKVSALRSISFTLILLLITAHRLPAPIHDLDEATPAPGESATPTPKPRLVYAPAPAFPPKVAQPGISGTGRFRLTFDAQGNVTNVQLIQSTGSRLFDEAAIKTLQQWKSSPSQGWSATVPVTFKTR
jgi:TonB family protein